MQNSYSACFPAQLHFGCGARKKIPAIMDALVPAGPRVFLVISASVMKCRAGKETVQLLGNRLAGTYSSVQHDPSLTCVDEIRSAAKEAGANCFLAVGGGSVIDACKTAALLFNSTAQTKDYFRGTLPLPRQGAPMAAVPTTAGTGAEITKNAVLTDEEMDVKASIRSPDMVPSAAINDPEFTIPLPPRITAHSGMDALTQAIESYVSLGANNFTRPLAAKAVAMLLESLPVAYSNGSSIEARTAAAEASMLTALAFAQSGLGAVHGLAHPIGHRLNTAHGLTCAVLLPYVIEYNMATSKDDYNTLARLAGLKDAHALQDKTRELNKIMNIPDTLPGLASQDFPYILSNLSSGSMKANPRPSEYKELERILLCVSGQMPCPRH